MTTIDKYSSNNLVLLFSDREAAWSEFSVLQILHNLNLKGIILTKIGNIGYATVYCQTTFPGS